MIRVVPQPEPADFAAKVAVPGEQWLNAQPWYDATQHAPCRSVPSKTKFPPYWTKVGKELYDVYGGVCAYLGIYFEYVTGASSVDHFLPKSQFPGLAYRWENYRLSCLGVNRSKRAKTKILDPFEIEDDWFDVDLRTGAIHPNEGLEEALKTKIRDTISALGIDQQVFREMRLRHIAHFLKKEISETYLKQNSPFIWHILHRNGLL